MTATAPQTIASFSNYYSLAQLQANKDNDATRVDDYNSSDGKAYMDRYRVHSKVLESALAKFLTDLRDAGQLTPIDFAERRGHRFANAWNRFVANDPNDLNHWDLDTLVSSINHALIMQMCARDVATAYMTVVGKLDKGSFSAWEFSERDNCDVTGTRLAMEMQAGWKPRLGVRDYASDVFEPLTEDAPMPCVLTHQIPAPTGEMLINDWFRFEGNLFTEIVKTGAPDESINTSQGCALLTEHYASKFGFMSVSVGNTCPAIVARDDHLLIGCVNEDALEGYDDDVDPDDIPDDAKPLLKGEVKGRVCTDLWWATMIDREVLVDILATKIPREQAEKYVVDCIAEYDIVTVRVTPGTVYFHYTTDKDDLASFACDGPIDVNRDAVNEPYVVVSSKPLTWSPLAKASVEKENTSKCRP